MADGANLGVSRHFATVGVGVPLMIAIAEFVGIRKKDPHYMLMAKRWTRGFVISVAVGVVTGTAISPRLRLYGRTLCKWRECHRAPLFMEVLHSF